MTRKNIAAFTEVGHFPPAYISVNSENEKCTITVRSRGDKGIAEIEMTPDQLKTLATDIHSGSAQKLVDDLAVLVRRLAHSTNKSNGNIVLAGQAMDYLVRNGLLATALREET